MKLWKHHAAQAPGGPHQRPRARRGEAWLARYGGLISSEWEFAKGLQLLEEDPELYDAHGPLGRGRRLDRLAADRQYVRNACTAGYKGICQDGEYPDREFLARPEPRVRRLRDGEGRPPDRRSSATRAGTLSAAGRGLDRAARGHRRGRRQRRRPRHRPRRRRGDRAGADGRDHGHLDLPRDERRHACARSPGCAASSTAGSSTGSRATRPGSPASATSSPGTSRTRCPGGYSEEAAASAGSSVHELLTELAADAAGRRARTRGPGLALGQPLGARGPRALRPGRRPDPGHPPEDGLPRPAGGHRLRHPHDRRGLQRLRRPGHRVRRGRRAAQERVPDADLRRRARHADLDDRLRPGPGPGLRHPRGRRRRRLPGRPRGRARRWAGSTRDAYTPNPAAADAYDALYAEYTALHDYFGRGGNDVMRRLKAIRRDGRSTQEVTA